MQHQFTTIRTADILDDLCAAVDLAREMAGDNARWQQAISNGWDDLLNLDTIAYDTAQHAIRIESASEPGRFYVANGDCQCTSFANGNACRHRAAARLVRRALEIRSDRAAAAESARLEGELDALAAELYAELAESSFDDDHTLRSEARRRAQAEIGAVLAYAAAYDAAAHFGQRLTVARAPYVATIAA